MVDYRTTASTHKRAVHLRGVRDWYTQRTATRYHEPGSVYTGDTAILVTGSIQASRRGCTDYTRASSVPGRARLGLRSSLILQEAVRGSRAKGPSSLPSLVAPITNGVISCIQCECDCRMKRCLAVHNTSGDEPMEASATACTETFFDRPSGIRRRRSARDFNGSIYMPSSECSIRGL